MEGVVLLVVFADEDGAADPLTFVEADPVTEAEELEAEADAEPDDCGADVAVWHEQEKRIK